MKGAARPLDVLAVGLGALSVAILVTGGFTVGRLPLTRAEDVVVALAIVAGLRALVHPYRLPHVRPERAALAGVLTYAVLMGFIVVTRHEALRTHALDLGYYVQLVWNIAHGHGARVTLPPMHAWGDHFSPVFYAFAPIAWVWPGAVPLLLAQTFVLAAGGYAVFSLAWFRLKDGGAAAALALLYLVNPSLHGVNLRDIHPQALAIALVPAAALAFDRGRYGWCAAALAVTLAGREDAAVAGVGFGIWLALARRQWLAGAVVAVASVAILAIAIGFVMPYFRGEPYSHLHRHAYLGTSLPEILVSLVARPWRWLPVVATLPKLVYLLAMLAPLGFLPLLAPRALAAALPALAVNLLSTDPVLSHHRSQYTAFLLPFLVLAAIDGYRALRIGAARRRWSTISPATAVALGFVVSVVLTARTVNDLTVTRWLLDPAQRAAHRLMAQVPRDVPASVNERLVAHLGARREIYIFPSGVPETEWVLDLGTQTPPPGYLMMAREGPWMLWRKAAAGSGLRRWGKHVRGVVVDQPPRAVRATLEEVRRECRRDRDLPAHGLEDVLRARHPREAARDGRVHVGQREPDLRGVLEDDAPGVPHRVPSGEQRPAGMHALDVLRVRPHGVHRGEIERFERAIEAGVRFLDGRHVEERPGFETGPGFPRARRAAGGSRGPFRGPLADRRAMSGPPTQ